MDAVLLEEIRAAGYYNKVWQSFAVLLPIKSVGGLTALFSMLNSCSSNVAVVNIDNGFGAGYMAAMINRL